LLLLAGLLLPTAATLLPTLAALLVLLITLVRHESTPWVANNNV
jgi:chromate transport protein ChrA